MSEIRRDDGDLVSNQDWNLGLDLEQKKYDDGKTREIQIKTVIQLIVIIPVLISWS